MSKRMWFSGLVVTAIVVIPVETHGQSWSAEQREVWNVIVESWDAIVAKDVAWSDKWVHPNAIGWGDENPTPRTRATIKNWDRFGFEGSTTLVHEENLLAMVVQGNTALAHYYYSQGVEETEGKRRTIHGRCSDVLIREGGRWQFIGWRCGELPSDDEG